MFTAIYYHFLSAAVALAVLERNLSFEPSSETITPRYLKLVNRPFLSYLTKYDIQIYHMFFVLEANYYWHMTHARRFAQDFIMDEIDFNLIQYKTKKNIKKKIKSFTDRSSNSRGHQACTRVYAATQLLKKMINT